MHLSEFVLVQPPGLEQSSWAAISSYAERLRIGLRGDDRELAVGSAKELVESVARAVLVARGDTAASKTDYLEVLKPAHAALEYQPGPGLTNDAAVRGIASAALKMVSRLRELRNDYGTGHGRAVAPVVEDEVLVLAVEGALLWVRWALRRLEHLLAGQLAPLINDLAQAVYSKKQWSDRLMAADIPHLEVEDQRRLGLAVGRRASRGTFVVREVGMEAPLDDPNDAAWPPAYREGTVEGAFLNAAGQVQLDDEHMVIEPVVRMIESSPTVVAQVRELRSKLAAASWSPAFVRSWRAATTVMRQNAGRLSSPDAQDGWLGIVADIETTGASIGAE